MAIPKILTLPLLLCCLLFTCACQHRQQGIITTIDGISSEHSYEGVMMRPAQFRLVNLSGLMPAPEVGMLTFHSPDRGPSTAIGISRDRTQSYHLIQEIPFRGDGIESLISIRNALHELDQQAGRLVEARYQRLLHLRSENEDNAAMSELTEKIESMQAEFDTQHSKVTEALDRSGVAIFRWTTRDGSSHSGRAGGVMSGSRKHESSQSGYAIVGGLRQSTLFVGEDIMEAFPHVARINWKGRWNNKYRSLTTQILQAEHLIWLSASGWESVSSIDAKLKKSDFANARDLLLAIDKVEIQRVRTRMQSLSNMAVMSAVKRQMKPIDWQAWDHAGGNDGWHTLLSVTARFSDIGYVLNREFGRNMRNREAAPE